MGCWGIFLYKWLERDSHYSMGQIRDGVFSCPFKTVGDRPWEFVWPPLRRLGWITILRWYTMSSCGCAGVRYTGPLSSSATQRMGNDRGCNMAAFWALILHRASCLYHLSGFGLYTMASTAHDSHVREVLLYSYYSGGKSICWPTELPHATPPWE